MTRVVPEIARRPLDHRRHRLPAPRGHAARASCSRPLGLPHLTGYLIAGIASGPYALKLVDEHTVKNLSPINTLALSLIALAGGAELDFATVRKGAQSRSAWAMLVQCVFVLVAVTALFFVAARPMIPFTRSLAHAARSSASRSSGARSP